METPAKESLVNTFNLAETRFFQYNLVFSSSSEGNKCINEAILTSFEAEIPIFLNVWGKIYSTELNKLRTEKLPNYTEVRLFFDFIDSNLTNLRKTIKEVEQCFPSECISLFSESENQDEFKEMVQLEVVF